MMAPGQEPKVNLTRLLRQVQNQVDQEKFTHKHGLLPDHVECDKCKDKLDQVYPLNNPAAKFKYFKCACSPREKIPVTKNTLLCKLSMPKFLVVLYDFCYRWKYSNVRREADLDGQVRSVGVPESPVHWLQCLAYRDLREGSDRELVRKDVTDTGHRSWTEERNWRRD